MEQTTPPIRVLFNKYLANEHTQAELNMLLHHFEVQEQPELLHALIQDELDRLVEESEAGEMEELMQNVQGRIFQEIRQTPQGIIRLQWRQIRSVAASIIFALAISAAVYWYVKPSNDTVHRLVQVEVDALPGSNRAILTLADGRPISLSEERSGIVIAANQLTYEDGTPIENLSATLKSGTGAGARLPGSGTVQTLEYAELSTPNGGTYQVTLPDGTRVWLNAASSLKYPLQFDSKIRKVILSGEGYFEVSHRNDQPFVVEVGNNTVEVLGTSFNINAYDAQPVTTLVEGSVRLKNQHSEFTLRPGQQSFFNGQEFVVQSADVQKFIAWKEGKFYFSRDNMVEIMNQLARWYDLEVEYSGKVPSEAIFSGKISRYVNLSEVLEMLSFVGGARYVVTDEKIRIKFDD